MTENEFLLTDRIQKIKSMNEQYDLENNAYISFSGGKDSNVLSRLIDLALPNNNIPRVYSDTGIELKSVRSFVLSLNDKRLVILKPKKNIKQMLQEDGFPFKSKAHSRILADYQRGGGESYKSVRVYLGKELTNEGRVGYRLCPNKLKYQFSADFKLKVSDKCCKRLKEEPLKDWAKSNNKKIAIVGIMAEEGGRRAFAKCAIFSKNGKTLQSFQPLVPLSKEWEDWFISEQGIKLPSVYYPPYNFERTGCKGCPFALNLQHELDILEMWFPKERKQCESIWKPVYDEYRRIGYRLKTENQPSLFGENK